MEIVLRRKYRTRTGVIGYPAKARTGNSHGPAKSRKKNGKQHPNQRSRVRLVDGLTGRSRMVDA